MPSVKSGTTRVRYNDTTIKAEMKISLLCR